MLAGAMGRSPSRGTAWVTLHLDRQVGWLGAIVLIVLVAVLVLDIAGVVFVVRRNRRLSRAARVVVAVIAAWTLVVAAVLFVQDASDWRGAFWTDAFVVLYGVIGCGVVFGVDAVARRLRQSKALSV